MFIRLLLPSIQASRKWTTVTQIALSDLLYTRRLQTSATLIYFIFFSDQTNQIKRFQKTFYKFSWHFQAFRSSRHSE